MDPEIKRQWLEALRSGKYAQGTNALRTLDNQFCCLGVLCDVILPGAWVKPTESEPLSYYYSIDRYKHSLSHEIQEMAGIPESFVPGDCQSLQTPISTLMRMNDDGESFETIADWIEKNL